MSPVFLVCYSWDMDPMGDGRGGGYRMILHPPLCLRSLLGTERIRAVSYRFHRVLFLRSPVMRSSPGRGARCRCMCEDVIEVMVWVPALVCGHLSVTAAKIDAYLQGTAITRCAVNQSSKSVLLKNCTLRSVGVRGERPPLRTRYGEGNFPRLPNHNLTISRPEERVRLLNVSPHSFCHYRTGMA